MITILGLGSLLSEESARRTCPTLQNFGLATITGYKRIFNKTDSILALSGNLPTDHKAYACLSAVPDDSGNAMIVSHFEIPEHEWAPLVKREFEYRLQSVPFVDLRNNNAGTGILCVGDYANDETCASALADDPVRAKLWAQFRQQYPYEPMWRTDLLPDAKYLERCLQYAQDIGSEVYENFLDTTFIGTGESIRQYLNQQPQHPTGH